jgi:hypothetical protein
LRNACDPGSYQPKIKALADSDQRQIDHRAMCDVYGTGSLVTGQPTWLYLSYNPDLQGDAERAAREWCQRGESIDPETISYGFADSPPTASEDIDAAPVCRTLNTCGAGVGTQWWRFRSKAKPAPAQHSFVLKTTAFVDQRGHSHVTTSDKLQFSMYTGPGCKDKSADATIVDAQTLRLVWMPHADQDEEICLRVKATDYAVWSSYSLREAERCGAGGKVYVSQSDIWRADAGSAPGVIDIYDATTNRFVDSFPTNHLVWSMRFDPTGKTIAAEELDGNFYAIDPQSAVQRPFFFWGRASPVIFPSLGGRFLFVGEGNQTTYAVAELDINQPPANNPFAAIDAGSEGGVTFNTIEGIAVSPEGDRLYWGRLPQDRSKPEYLAVVAMPAGVQLGSIALSRGFDNGMVMAPDAKRLYVEGGDALSVVDLSTNSEVSATPFKLTPIPDLPLITQDGTRIIVGSPGAHTSEAVNVIDVTASPPKLLLSIDVEHVNDDAMIGSVAINPNGSRIFVNTDHGGHITGGGVDRGSTFTVYDGTTGQLINSVVRPAVGRVIVAPH